MVAFATKCVITAASNPFLQYIQPDTIPAKPFKATARMMGCGASGTENGGATVSIPRQSRGL